MMPNHEKKRNVLCKSMFVLTNRQTLILKKWWEEKFFLRNQCINVIYSNKKNEFMVPNHERNGDYYVKPCLFQLTNEL